MLQAFLVALTVFVCVGGAELAGFTMLNRPIVIGPLVGLFLGDLHTGVIVGAWSTSAGRPRLNRGSRPLWGRPLRSCWGRVRRWP